MTAGRAVLARLARVAALAGALALAGGAALAASAPGAAPGAPPAAVDVYGLGATLFAALTGRAPFDGKDAAQVVKRVMIEEPPPVEKLRPDIPKAVGAVVRRAMAKERGVRFATAGEFSDALSKIC